MKKLFPFKNKRALATKKSLKKAYIKRLHLFVRRARIAYMELNLRLHLVIRLLHDKLYKNNKTYKGWSDKSYSEAVHKATLTGFVASFLIFGFLQYAVPNIFDFLKSNKAYADQNSVTWDTNTDFTTNTDSSLVQTDGNISVSGSGTGSSVTLGPSDSYDFGGVLAGTDGELLVDGGSTGGATAKYTISGVDHILSNTTPVYAGPFNSLSNALVLDQAFLKADNKYYFSKVTLRNGAYITHSVMSAAKGGTEGIEIYCSGAIVIDGTSSIDVSGKSAMRAPAGNGGGGGYAGVGGKGKNLNGGIVVGSQTDLSKMGSAGARGFIASVLGGNGGGRIKIAAASMLVSGKIQSNGFGGKGGDGNGGGGGGSGGGVVLSAIQLDIPGLVSSVGGGGGGGDSFSFDGASGSNGVGGNGGASQGSTHPGGAGGAMGLGGAGGNGTAQYTAAAGGNGGPGAGGGGASNYNGGGAGGGGGAGRIGITYGTLVQGNLVTPEPVSRAEAESLLPQTDWSASGGLAKSNSINSSLTYIIPADIPKVSVIAATDTFYGKADISLDGGAPTTADLYSEGYSLPCVDDGDDGCMGGTGVYLGSLYANVYSANITDTSITHTLTISVRGDKNAASTATTINVDAVGLYGDNSNTYLDGPGALSGKIGPYAYWIHNQDNYKKSAFLGGESTSSGKIGLRGQIDKNVHWSSIGLVGRVPATTTVNYLVRFNDSLGSGDFVNPQNKSQTDTFSATVPAGIYTSAAPYVMVIGSQEIYSKTIEIYVSLTGTGKATPVVDTLVASYDGIDVAAVTIRKDDASVIVPGGWTNETGVKITSDTIACEGCGTSTERKLEVETQRLDVEFTNTASATGNFNDANFLSIATINGLDVGTSYHLQTRTIDKQGRQSPWVPYNSDGVAFSIEQTAPTGSVSINNTHNGFVTSRNITITPSATDTGTAGASGLAQMRFSNNGTNWGSTTNADGSIANTSWMPYSGSAQSWNLPSGEGNKTVYVQYRDNAGNVSGFVQSSDADFNVNNSNSLDISGGALKLPASSWMAGIPGTILEGKFVKSQNETTLMDWDTAQTVCASAGGRVATMSELAAINAGRVTYLAESGVYWSSEAYSGLDGKFYSIPDGFSSHNRKYVPESVRCVSNSVMPYLTTGEFESKIFDSNSVNTLYNKLSFGQLPVPSGTTMVVSVRTGTTPTYDIETWTTYQELTSGEEIPVSSILNGKQYSQYKVSLTGGSATPVFSENVFQISTGNTVTLDTAPPANVSNLKIYQDNTKTNQLTDNTKWYTYPSPYYEWSANTETDIKEYRYCFDTSAACPLNSSANLTTNFEANLTSASDAPRYLRVDAIDNAGNSSTPVTLVYNFDKTLPGEVTGFSGSSNDLSKITLGWNEFIAGQGAPIDSYKLERVKHSEYQLRLWDQTSNWSTGDGYASFSLNSAGFVDDSAVSQQGQVTIETSVKYVYRIAVKDLSNSQYSTPVTVTGLTRDGRAPEDIVGVKAAACDGTTGTVPGSSLSKCSNIENRGFEIALTWNVTTDVGTGVNRYFVYRADTATDRADGFVKIAEVPAVSNIYYDNDANNVVSGNMLNDSSTYYYRITAIDGAGNESSKLPTLDPTQNAASATTPDVTAPSVPGDVVATALGLDGSDPNTAGGHQRVQLTWSASSDVKARSTSPGSGVAGYQVYRATDVGGPYIDVTNDAKMDCDVSTRTCINDSLVGFSYYYYQIRAVDNTLPAPNISDYSLASGLRTASDDVPGVPTSVSVTSTKGNPSVDVNVGDVITTTFVGSSAKNYQVVRYQVFRSTTNYTNATDWLNPTKATQLKLTADPTCGLKCYSTGAMGGDIDIAPKQDDRNLDSPYIIRDAGLVDAATYYYKVRAMDNTPAVPAPGIGGPYYSGLSAVTPGTPGAGWDITPDATRPVATQEGMAIKVKDTYSKKDTLRNILTWLVPEEPTRNEGNDFGKYEIWREIRDLGGNMTEAKLTDITDFTTNMYIDEAPIELQHFTFSYYILVYDDAGTAFKYSDTTPINPGFSNKSDKIYAGNTIVPADTTPELEVNTRVELTSINVSSATIEWYTNQTADSLVEYRVQGAEDDYVAVGNRDSVKHHIVKIFDLLTDTPYEYRVVSRNKLGNDMVISKDLPSLRTARFAIVVPEKESDFKNATTSTVQFNWSTTKDAKTNYIEFEATEDPNNPQLRGIAGQLATSSGYNLKEHAVVLKGLRSHTRYRFKIKSVSTDNYQAEEPAGVGNYFFFETNSFDTAQFTLAPSSSNVAERNITATTAQIAWETANLATSWVDYGTVAGVLNSSAGNDELVRQHLIKIEGLIPGTKYFYRVRVTDEFGNVYTSQEYTFTAVLKPKISNMTVKDVTPYSVTVAWDTNVDTETIVNWGKTAAYGEKRGKSGVSKVHEIVIDKLDDNQEYHYQILATDDAGNEVADTDKIVRTPLDTEGPKITNVKIDVLPMGESDTTSSIIVSWQTNKPASTLVEYGEGVIGGTYDKRSVEDTTLNNSHTVIIKGLTPASSYHYRLVSADKRSNKTISQDYTFVTPSKEKSILQLIIKSLEETFAWTRNLNQFFGNIGRRMTGN